MGVLGRIETLFNDNVSDIYYLPSLPHMLKGDKKIKQNHSLLTINEALSFINNYSPIPDDFFSEDLVNSLSEIDDIDSGEQILFSINLPFEEFYILTGDKRALISLSRSNLTEIQSRLKGRIICLEEIMLKLLPHIDMDNLIVKAKTHNFCSDKVLKICLNQTAVTLQKLEECILSYLNELKKESINLFI